MNAVQDTSQSYGLTPPTYADALESLRRVHLGNVDGLWRQLLETAGITQPAPDEPVGEEVLQAMLRSDPVTQLTGHALRILQRSYVHLRATAAIIRGAS